MGTYMVVATFKPDTDMGDVFAVVKDELDQVEVLRAEDRIGSIHISMVRGKTFIEIFAPDESSAEAIVKTLPMSKWWDLDIYPTTPPALPGA
jgi:hypothetical protein